MSRTDDYKESLFQNSYDRLEDSKDPDGYTSNDETLVSKVDIIQNCP